MTEKATDIYHMLRSVEILTNFKRTTNSEDASDMYDMMITNLLNDVSHLMGFKRAWYVKK